MGKHDLLPTEAVWIDWTPLWFFPWVERRRVLVKPIFLFFNQYRWRK